MPQSKSSITVRLLVALALLAGGIVIGYLLLGGPGKGGGMLGNILPKAVISDQATLSLLRSEAMSFLVTRRTVTQIVVEHNESDWTGQWQGVLWATVSWRWGVDMSKLSEKDIRRTGEVIYCRLPEPELLDYGIVPGSENFMSKSTAFPKMQEFFQTGQQQHKLQETIPAAAMRFAKDQNLCPSRLEMVRQLNDTTAAIKQATNLDLRFE
jgi:hypothetical protein